MSVTACMNTASLAFDVIVKPLSLRTNCSDASRISSSVAGGSKLKRVLMLRHMAGANRRTPACYADATCCWQTRRRSARSDPDWKTPGLHSAYTHPVITAETLARAE